MNYIFEPIKQVFKSNCQKLAQRSLLYILKTFLGEYTNLRSDQVNVSGLSKQDITVNDVVLNPEAVNTALKDSPVEVIDGYIGQFQTSVPWQDLGSKVTSVNVQDVDFVLRPKAPRSNAAQLLEAMSVSMMETSYRCMEEAFREEDPSSSRASESFAQSKEVQEMTKIFEKIKWMVHVTVKNITLRLEVVKDGKVIGLELHFDRLEFFDDRAQKENQTEKESDVDSDDENRMPLAWLIKNVHAYGITLKLDDEAIPSAPVRLPDSTGTSPIELFVSASSEVLGGSGSRHCLDEEEDAEKVTPVLIASLAGKSELKIKMKANENVEGPKVDIDCHMGALHILLSPKQLQNLTGILTQFMIPSESSSPSNQMGAVNRPMGPDDYRKIDQALQLDLKADRFEDVTEPLSGDYIYLAEKQPMFFPLQQSPPLGKVDMNLSTSSLDTVGTTSTKATSEFPSTTSAAEKRQKSKEKDVQKIKTRTSHDPFAERNRYQITLATLSACILHEEPHDGRRKDWVARMSAMSEAYFIGIRTIPTVGQAAAVTMIRDRISAILAKDHLGLLCKPVTVCIMEHSMRSGQSSSLELNIHSAELVECLYDSRKSGHSFSDPELASVPQYSEILTFPKTRTQLGNDLTACSPLSPAIHMNTTITSKTGHYGYTYKETKVSLELGSLVTEVDITIQDRLNTLLNTLNKPKPAIPQFGQSLLTTDGTSGFDVAMQDGSCNNNPVSINVSCPQATIRVRFPIPDLRPTSQHIPREWWGRNLHKESLLLEVDNLSLFQQGKPEAAPSAPSETEIICSKIEVYFQEDFNRTPILFGSIQQGSGDVGDNFNRPRMVIKTFPLTSTPFETMREESGMDSLNGGFSGVDENEILFAAPGSTPFSLSKDITHGTEGFEGEDQEGFKSTFEKISPGNKEEIRKFIDVSSSNTSLLVEITGPKVLVLLHNKPFLELLYNRINNDLLLWEPQSPSPPEAFVSGLSLNVQPYISLMGHMTQSFHECLQGQFDSDSDTEDLAGEGTGSQEGRRQEAKYSLPSTLCLSLNIGEGKLFANVPVKETGDVLIEGCHGELLVIVKDASLFASVGHEGDKDLRYLTFNANRASLLHAGAVDDHIAPVTMEHLDTLTPDNNHHFQHMENRIYRSEHSVPVEPLSDVGMGDNSEDMVSVAVKIKVDTLNNNKHFCVAAAVKAGTLRHKKFGSGESWIDLVIELLNLTDFPIQGYVMPKVLTDLHIDLIGCACDYRPINFTMPLRALVTAQRFSMAVNLNSETEYTSIKFLLDEAKLWLSDKTFMEIRLKQDYVCLAHLTLLEIGLRLGQVREGSCKTLLWLSNSKTELRMCADSCAIFTSLVQHFVHDGDLKTSEQMEAELQKQAEKMENSVVMEDEWTTAQHQRVEKMVAEALMESKPPSLSTDGPEVHQQQSRPLYFMPNKGDVVQQDRVLSVEMPIADGLPEEGIDWVDEDEEEFTIICDPGLGIAPKNGEPPVVQWYTDQDKPLDINWEFLAKPASTTAADELKTPGDYPAPEFKCMIREWNIDVCFYGGNDFWCKEYDTEEKKPKGEEHTWQTSARKLKASVPAMWRGGVNRRHDVMTKLTLHKLRLNYEKYAEAEVRSRRLVLLVKKLELEDHLQASKFNKFLYWPSYDISHEGANMICLKVLWERPDSRFNTEECSVMLTQQGVRLHINQDTLQFMQYFFINIANFFSDISSTHSETPSPTASPTPSSKMGTPQREKKSASRERAPILSVEGTDEEEKRQMAVDNNLMRFDESTYDLHQVKPRPGSAPPKRVAVETEDDPTFFKSFVMTRPVHIIVDYCGTCAGINRSDDLPTLAKGVVTGLLKLENVEIKLNDLEMKRGYKGLGKLVEAIVDHWVADIRANQMGRVVGGIGPLSAFTHLRIQDFVTLPYVQYQRDGRVWRGLQKGACSLGKAAQLAFLDLLQRVIDSIMVLSECGFDFLSSGKSVRSYRSRFGPGQPKDIREGVRGAYAVLCDGVKGTVTDLVNIASQQREQKGVTGAVGTIAKEGPAMGIFGALHYSSKAVGICVTAGRYTLDPDARKEDKEKWKSDS